MNANIKVTRKIARLLKHMLEYQRINSPVTGVTASLVGKTGPATFYPAIERMQQAGWARKEWGPGPTYEEWEKDPEKHGRPRQRWYFLTDDGVCWAKQAVAEYESRKPWYKRLAKWIEDAADDVTGDD